MLLKEMHCPTVTWNEVADRKVLCPFLLRSSFHYNKALN